jgi:hypothetical protein
MGAHCAKAAQARHIVHAPTQVRTQVLMLALTQVLMLVRTQVLMRCADAGADAGTYTGADAMCAHWC